MRRGSALKSGSLAVGIPAALLVVVAAASAAPEPPLRQDRTLTIGRVSVTPQRGKPGDRFEFSVAYRATGRPFGDQVFYERLVVSGPEAFTLRNRHELTGPDRRPGEAFFEYVFHRPGDYVATITISAEGYSPEVITLWFTVAPALAGAPATRPGLPEARWEGTMTGKCSRTFDDFTVGGQIVRGLPPDSGNATISVRWIQAHNVYEITWGSQRIVGAAASFGFDDSPGKCAPSKYLPGCLYKSRPDFRVSNGQFAMSSTGIRVSARFIEDRNHRGKMMTLSCSYTAK